jgi:serine/threonine protein kinase
MRNQNIAEGAFIGGTYKVLDYIGEGGMGLVYKVAHPTLDRPFALKILKSDHLSDVAWKRFRAEAQAIARLDHINIVKIFDMAEDDGHPFYTMDFLSGQSLDERLQEHGPLSLADALPIFAQVCAGLAYAHERNIIHRDIKPANIMLVEDSRQGTNHEQSLVKIVDFGIAKLRDHDGNTLQGLTRPGEVFGSPLYMSPEQCCGQKLDQRSDIYAVGVTFFQVLTGRPPLLGKSALETVALHQSQIAPRLADFVGPDIFPEKLEQIIARMLAKDPQDRYESLQVVARDLAKLAGDGRTSAPHSVRHPNFFNLNTTGNTSSSSSSSSTFSGTNPALKRASLIKWSALALLILAVPLGFFAIINPRAATRSTGFTKPPLVSTVSAVDTAKAFDDALVNSHDAEKNTGARFDQEVTDKVKEDVTEYLKSRLTNRADYRPYLQTDKNSKNKVFYFPEKFTFGNLIAIQPRKTEAFPCTGKVVVSRKALLKFRANDVTCHFPALLKLFTADDLAYLTIDHARVPGHELFDDIAHMKQLNDLELFECPVVDSDIVRLDGFPKLRSLMINRAGVSGLAIAKCNFPQRLSGLILLDAKNITPLLKKLVPTGTIYTIGLDRTVLADEDYELLAKMPQLHELRLKNTNIDNANLEKLTVLKNIRTIRLTNCERLTPAAILSLKKMRTLEVIDLPPSLANRNTKTILSTSLPHLRELR